MSVELLKPPPRPDDPTAAARKEKMLALLRGCIEDVEEGTLTGVLLIGETPMGYDFTRTNVPIEKAMGLLARAIHRLNREWDTA